MGPASGLKLVKPYTHDLQRDINDYVTSNGIGDFRSNTIVGKVSTNTFKRLENFSEAGYLMGLNYLRYSLMEAYVQANAGHSFEDLKRVIKSKSIEAVIISKDYSQKRLLEIYTEAEETFGYETKVKRREIELEKSHSNDAFVIASGKNQIRSKEFEVIQKRKNNRCLQLNRKGFKPSIKKERSKIQPLDLFWVKGKKYICKGMFNCGKYICYGSTKLKEYFKISEVEKYYYQGSLVWN